MTEQITHTPGPREYETVWSEVFKRFNSARTVRIADCGTTGVSVRECQANARLIAAAPDLLRCLSRLVQLGEDDGSAPTYAWKDAFEDAARTVAKAEGRQSESSDAL